MKITITLLLFCAFGEILGQSGTILTFDDDTKYKLENGASISSLSENKVLKLNAVSQQLRIPAVSNLSQINFDISSVKDGNASLKFYYVSHNKLNLIETKSLSFYNTPKNDNLKHDILGTYDLIIQYEKSDAGEIYLDNFVYYSMSSDRVSLLTTTEILEQVLTAKKQEGYEAELKESKTISKENFKELHVLYNKYNALDNITKTALFIDSRSAMINPINYASFKKTLDTLKNSCDTNSKLLIENIEKKLENYKAKAANSTSVVGKLFTVGSNILNLVSGGQFNSLFNSLNTITATVFNRDVLESRNIDISNMVTYKDNNPAKKVIGIAKQKVYNAPELKKATEQGIRLQSFFTTFLDEIENQQSEYLDLMENFKLLSGSIEIRSDSILGIIKSQYKFFDVSFNYDTIIKVSQATNIDKQHSIIKANEKISKFFNDRKSLGKGEHLNTLRALQTMNILINQNRDRYIQNSSKLYESFLLFAIDFDKKNPYEPTSKMFTEFDSLKRASMKNYIDLIDSLDKTLSKPAKYAYYKERLDIVRSESRRI